MAVKKKVKKTIKTGRRTKYTPEVIDKICKYLEQGYTAEDACKIANVAPATYFSWVNKHIEFSEAVKRAKEAFEEWQMKDLLKEAKKSLKTLICGLEYEEIKTEYEQNPLSPDAPKIKKQTRTTKKVLPNATAVIFALCNRDPEHWQNRISNEIAGKIETEAKQTVSLAKVPDELLGQLIDCIQSK